MEPTADDLGTAGFEDRSSLVERTADNLGRRCKDTSTELYLFDCLSFLLANNARLVDLGGLNDEVLVIRLCALDGHTSARRRGSRGGTH